MYLKLNYLHNNQARSQRVTIINQTWDLNPRAMDPDFSKGLIQISDMDLVGSALIWVRGSGSRGIK